MFKKELDNLLISDPDSPCIDKNEVLHVNILEYQMKQCSWRQKDNSDWCFPQSPHGDGNGDDVLTNSLIKAVLSLMLNLSFGVSASFHIIWLKYHT